jgi:hypothetical protein
MTKLSDVPLSELRTDEDWLISAQGVRGQLVDIKCKIAGNRFEHYLHIKWRNGSESYPDWPYECDKVTVDDSYQYIICSPYAFHHVDVLNNNIEYLKRFSSK